MSARVRTLFLMFSLALPACQPTEHAPTGSTSGSQSISLPQPAAARGEVLTAPTQFVVLEPASPSAGVALAADQVASLLDQATDLPIVRAKDGDALNLTASTWVLAVGSSALSSAVVASSELSTVKAEGYILRMGTASGGTVLAAVGPDDLGTQYAAYALLERLGFGFFHPEDTFIPEALSLPSSLDETHQPSYRWRGMHVHTMHPIELMDALLVSSPEHLEEAKHYVDWLVANRQNYFQWVLQDTIDLDEWLDHAAEIVRYAHDRGLKVGIDTPYEFIQQNAWVLVPYVGPWEPQLESRLRTVLEVPFDVINVELGSSEFLPTNDVTTVEMLDYSSALLDEQYGKGLISKVHVSSGQTAPNYDDINFNFLPGVADPRVGVLPHSVQFYDLYRIAPTYDNEDFSEIREFLLGEIGERTVLYYPETAYWCSVDIDVPLYLPQYIYSRWNDLYQLKDSGMDGQVNFTSGFEWGYWLHDYSSASFSYEAGGHWMDPVGRFTRIFGESADEVQQLMADVIQSQGDELLEANLIAWLVGWDAADDLGHLIDTHAQPVRPIFAEVASMSESEIIEFDANVLPQLSALEADWKAFGERAAALEPSIPSHSARWYRELKRGIDVLALRTGHIHRLYRGAVLKRMERLGMEPDGEAQAAVLFEEAQTLRRQAEGVVAEQEAEYRFPADRLARRRDNPTSYEYGYLFTASDLYFWRREELQAIDDNFCPCMGNLNNMLANLFGEGHPIERMVYALPTLSSDCLDQCIHPINQIEDLGGSQ